MNIITQEVKPPHRLESDKKRFDIFVAGSIEMGKAEEWQKDFCDEIKKMRPHPNVALFNPRRDDWDPTWNDDVNRVKLVEQIKWELEHLQNAKLIVFYFQPGTVSAISLLELGLFKSYDVIVFCPRGFDKKTNVDIVCELFNVETADSMEDLLAKTKKRIKAHQRF